MIQCTRALIRQVRAVFRRCVRRPYGPLPPPLVEFRAGPEGLRIQLSTPEVFVEYHQGGRLPAASLCLALEALADFEGKGNDVVTLEGVGANQVLGRWQDGGVPQEVEYAAPDRGTQPAFPEPPARFARNPGGLLHALDEATHIAPTDAVRYASQRLQLSGRAGAVVATDGRQLLLQGGFTFPWQEDVLVPRLPAAGCKELGGAPVEVGKADGFVGLRTGPWAFGLKVDAEGRYPRVEHVIPTPPPGATRLRIDPEDAAFLAKALPKLPGGDGEHGPLTVDLDGRVCVRARPEGGGRPTEVVLARSAYSGRPVRFCLNRKYLGRLLELGFAEVVVSDRDTPLLCQDGKRTYVCVPLPGKESLEPAEDSLLLESATAVTATNRRTNAIPAAPAPDTPAPERRKVTVPTPHQNVSANGHAGKPANTVGAPPPNGGGLGALINEAQSLKETLRDAYTRSNQLVAALKRHRKSSKLMQSTLASLRQLQKIEG